MTVNYVFTGRSQYQGRTDLEGVTLMLSSVGCFHAQMIIVLKNLYEHEVFILRYWLQTKRQGKNGDTARDLVI